MGWPEETMHRRLVWATPIALGMAGVNLAGVPAPAGAGQERADLLVQVRVESPCISTLRGGLIEQRCATRTPASARIEPALAPPSGEDGDRPLAIVSGAGQPGPSYITVIY
jgi:hypothetical protein